MANESTLGLIFSINADPSKAEAAVSSFNAKIKESAVAVKQASEPVIVYDRAMRGATASAANWEKIADAELAKLRQTTTASAGAASATQRLAASHREDSAAAMTAEERIALRRRQYDALAVSAKNLGRAPFLSAAEAEGLRIDKQLMAEIRTEAAGMGTSIQDAGERGLQGIMASLGGLRQFRALMFSTIGIISFGFYISEWQRVAEAIREGIHWMEGFDSASQTAFQDLIKGSQDALVNFQGLTTQQKIWQAQQLIAQTQQRINFDIASRQAIEAQSYWHDLGMEIKGVMDALGGNTTTLGLFAAQFGVKSGALQDELQQEALLTKQEKELANLEKQLQQEQKRTAGSTDKLAASMGRLAEQEQQFQFQGFLRNLQVGSEFAKQQMGLMSSLAAQRFAALQAALNDYASFQKAAASAEARSLAQSARQEDQYLKATEQNMSRHARTIVELQKQLASGGSFAGVSFQALGQTFSQFNAGLRQASELASVAIQPISHLQFAFMQVKEAAQMSGLSLRSFSDEMGRNVAMAIVYGNDIGKAMEQAAKAEAESIAARSAMWALYYFAHGIADIFWNPPRAAADFAASAEFAAIGGAFAALGAAIPSGASAAAGSSSGAVAAAAAGGTSGSAAQQNPPPGPLTPKENGQSQPQQVLQVVFNGPIYGGPSGMQEIAQKLNEQVEFGRVRLVASHTLYGKSLA